MFLLVVSHLRKVWLDNCYLNQYFSNYCDLIGQRKELAIKVLLEHSHVHFFFWSIVHIPCRFQQRGQVIVIEIVFSQRSNIYCLVLFRKRLSSPHWGCWQFVVISGCGKRKVHDNWRWGVAGTICCGWKNECLYLALLVLILASLLKTDFKEFYPCWLVFETSQYYHLDKRLSWHSLEQTYVNKIKMYETVDQT